MKKILKSVLSFAIVLIMTISVCPIEIFAEVPDEDLGMEDIGNEEVTVADDYTGIVECDGVYKYYENGKVNTEVKTLCKYKDVWYYVEGGQVKEDATTLCYYYGTWYYVEKGKINWNCDTLCYYYGTWYYVKKGVVDWNAELLCDYYGTQYYVKKGQIDWNFTNLFKYNDIWYYVRNGAVVKNEKTLYNYYGTWYYINDGKIDWDSDTLCYYYGTWYHVRKGVVDWNTENIIYYYGTWYYVRKGEVDWNATTLFKYYGTWYYIEKGQLNWNAITLCKYYDTWYYVENGVINWNCNTYCYYYGTWYAVKNGTVNWNAPTLSRKYINVGTGTIAEVVKYNAETLDYTSSYNSTTDWSRPTNNYLPEGTVDYCSETNISGNVSGTTKSYVPLRCGFLLYTEAKDTPRGTTQVTKKYKGTLPDHNEIGFKSIEDDGRHTVLTFDSLWKAPFYLDIMPQTYKNPSTQDYRVDKITYDYVDITFCYSTVFTGDVKIPESNPLFKSAKVWRNSNDYTLRLYLKKRGAFYGWDSYYNSNNQLCFSFLNPKKISIADNAYGVNLNGAVILIDVGHGGADPGSAGYNKSSNNSEAKQNLFLANKIKAELESIGATVVMTRTSDTTSSTDDKLRMIRDVKPDYCIAIHHDSSTSSSANGFSAYYHHAFSKNAAEFVLKETKELGSLYQKYSELSWHYYFMARSSVCPVVLTENGFMSNQYDFNNITNDSKNTLKAKAITKGIVDYFKSIQ